MSGLTPEEVVELKHSLAGMAELLATYRQELIHKEFTREEALQIVIAWQSALIGRSGSE